MVPPIVAEATADLEFRAHADGGAPYGRKATAWCTRAAFPARSRTIWPDRPCSARRIGLVGGGGRIGTAVARRARGFDMRVLYWSPRRKAESLEREFAMSYAPLDELLATIRFRVAPFAAHAGDPAPDRKARARADEADRVSDQHRARRDRGRGGARRARCKKRQIAGAGLDVFEHEPKVTPALLRMSNVVTTPHLGSAVLEVREQMANIVVDNILALLAGKNAAQLRQSAGPAGLTCGEDARR